MSYADEEHHHQRMPSMITLDDDELRTWFGLVSRAG